MLRSRKTYFTVIFTAIFVLFSFIYMIMQDNSAKNRNNTGNNSAQFEKMGTETTKGTSNKTVKPGESEELGNISAEQEKEQEKRSNIKDIKVKAIYISGPSASDRNKMQHVIELINKTELNAVVIDIKENGVVNYKSEVPEVRKNKLYINYYDPRQLLSELHENNIFVIGRIVCFRDPGLASKRTDLAIKAQDGSLWKEEGILWSNPYKEEVRNYNIDIAKEAAKLGFDEIQFDYVRFPSASKSSIHYGNNLPSKSDIICGFLKTAAKEIRDGLGIPVSADTFGIICESKADGERIGQVLEKIGMDIDYICPMLYPSHYANASNGVMGNGIGQIINGIKFEAPDLEPYKVVYNSLLKTKARISEVEGYRAKIRPYLQDFTASYIRNKKYYQVYGPKQVREQIQAVYDAGYDEWILWSGKNVYSEGALKLE